MSQLEIITNCVVITDKQKSVKRMSSLRRTEGDCCNFLNGMEVMAILEALKSVISQFFYVVL